MNSREARLCAYFSTDDHPAHLTGIGDEQSQVKEIIGHAKIVAEGKKLPQNEKRIGNNVYGLTTCGVPKRCDDRCTAAGFRDFGRLLMRDSKSPRLTLSGTTLFWKRSNLTDIEKPRSVALLREESEITWLFAVSSSLVYAIKHDRRVLT